MVVPMKRLKRAQARISFSSPLRRFGLIIGFVYLDYYGLTEPPFNLTPNPRFLFFSAKHREAFNHLLFGVRERKGFVQLTGEVGAGKTTVCRAALEKLDATH